MLKNWETFLKILSCQQKHWHVNQLLGRQEICLLVAAVAKQKRN